MLSTVRMCAVINRAVVMDRGGLGLRVFIWDEGCWWIQGDVGEEGVGMDSGLGLQC